jgi:hypothetical protein
MGLLFIPQAIYEYGEPWWNDTDRVKLKNSEKPVPEPLYPPQMSHGLMDLCDERMVTNCLSHGTAYSILSQHNKYHEGVM